MPYVLVSRSQTSCLSVSMWVCVINSCAQIMHAIRILRSRRWMMPNYNLSTAQCSSLNLHIPPAPGGASPLHRTGNALTVFCVAAVGKICTLLKNPLTQIVEKVRYDTIVEFNVDSIAYVTMTMLLAILYLFMSYHFKRKSSECHSNLRRWTQLFLEYTDPFQMKYNRNPRRNARSDAQSYRFFEIKLRISRNIFCCI